MPTVYLRQTAGAIRVRRGALVASIEPGTYADVSDEEAALLEAAGATRRSRPAGGDDDPEEE